MKCNELRQHLERSVERRNPLSLNDWREHLEHCSACREACEDYQLLDHAVEEWTNLDDAPDLTEQILAALEGEDTTRPALPLQKYDASRFVMGLVAAVVVLFLAFNLPRTQQVDPPATLVNGPPLNQTDLEPTENVDLDRVVLETRNAYGSLLGQAQSTMSPLKSALVRNEPENSTLDDESSNIASLQIVPAELEPLKAELTQSFGFLSALIPENHSN